MINVRELMIGNLLYRNHEIVEFDSFQAWHISELEPIPLSEEWLIKAGFVKKINSSVFKLVIQNDFAGTKMESSIQEWSSDFQICRSGINALTVKCQYVHQLQNLFYAITGSELTIK